MPTTLWAFQQQRAAPPRQPSELERAAEEFKTLTRDMGLRADSPHKATLKAGVKNAWHGRVFENFRNNVLDAVPHEVSQRGGAARHSEAQSVWLQRGWPAGDSETL